MASVSHLPRDELPLHPAVSRERKAAQRLSRLAAQVGTGLAVSAVSGVGGAVVFQTGRWQALVQPGFVVPMLVTAAGLAGLAIARRRASRERVLLAERTIVKSSGGRPPRTLDVRDVERISLMERPSGVHAIFEGRGGPLSLHLGYLAAARGRALLSALERGVEGLDEVVARLDRVPEGEDYVRLSAGTPPPGGEDDERLLACHEALGCWHLASAQLLRRWRTGIGGEGRRMLARLWQIERHRLGLMGAYRFLETAAPRATDDVFWEDRLRLSLCMGLRHDVEALLDAAPEDSSLPTDQWRRNLSSGPPFRPRLMGLVDSGPSRVLAQGLELGGGRVLPSWAAVAVTARRGAVGIKDVEIRDLWGQRHQIPAGRLEPEPDEWIVRLRHCAPWVLELAEDHLLSNRPPLRLVRELAGSGPAAPS